MVPSLVKGAAAGRLALRAAVAKNATPVLTAACSTSSEPPPPKAELKKGDQRSIGNRRWTVIGYANWSLLIRRNEKILVEKQERPRRVLSKTRSIPTMSTTNTATLTSRSSWWTATRGWSSPRAGSQSSGEKCDVLMENFREIKTM